MAKKRGRIENEIMGGELTHNPFAALGGSEAAADRVRASDSPEPETGPAAGPSPGLVARFEAKGHGGKVVTRVSGLRLGDVEFEALARRLRKVMGTGARVEGEDLVLQGKLVERVAGWLEENGHGKVVRGN